jgi:glycerate 2-kinase
MTNPGADPRGFLQALYAAAVRQADPLQTLHAHLPPPPKGCTVVVGAGKAGGAMAHAVDDLWPRDKPLSGLVITRYGHVPPAYAERVSAGTARVKVVEAAHPVPDAAGAVATQSLMQLVQGLTPDDLVLCLISGGGSALLSAPAPGLTLADKQAINKALLLSGAAIGEMNCVRRHLSAVKGGRLAALCAPARLVTLAISDVPGDDPVAIASGPTVADPSTCADALAILRRYQIALPSAASAGLESAAYETPKPGDPRLAGHIYQLVATPRQSLEAAARLAQQAGLRAHILSDEIEGESRDVGRLHAALAREASRQRQSPHNPMPGPCVILSGGGNDGHGAPRGRRCRAGRAGGGVLAFVRIGA